MLDHLIVTIYGYIVSIHHLIHGFGSHIMCPHLMPTAKLTPRYTGESALGDGYRTVTVRKSPDPDLTWYPLKN